MIDSRQTFCRLLIVIFFTVPGLAAATPVNVPVCGESDGDGKQECSLHEWQTRANDPDRLHLIKDGQQIGAFCRRAQIYRPFDPHTETWGEPCPPPVTLPVTNFGIVQEKLQAARDKYILNGQEISKRDAYQAVEKQLVDDSHKLRVTVIGSEPQRRQVMADLAQDAELRSWAVCRDYPADHWLIADAGFARGGSPTIYCQSPSGKVLHRQDDYQGGAAPTLGALRKAKSHYDAKKDPDLRRDSFLANLGNLDLGRVLAYLAALLAGFLGTNWFTKKQI